MYAVIETGGKQYRVELGTELAVERLDGDAGDTIDFERVLLVADGDEASIGMPVVADALVRASVVRQGRAEKVIVFKYRPKARHRAKKGHRQDQTVIRVADIRFNGRSAADEASAQEKLETQARQKAAAEAERKAAADQALAARLQADAAAQAAKTAAKTAAKPARRARGQKTSAAAESAPEGVGEKTAEAAQTDGGKPSRARTRTSTTKDTDAAAAKPTTTRPRQKRSKKDE